MSEIEQQAQAVASARQVLEEKKRQAQEAEEALKEQRESLPNVASQQALRGQKFGQGLQGRALRQKVLSTREDIIAKEGMVSGFREDLSSYEKELNQAQGQIDTAVQQEAAWNSVQNAAERGAYYVGLLAVHGEGYEKEYAQKWMKNRETAKQDFEREINKIQLENPSEKLIVDWKNMRIKGIQSSALSQSLPLNEYNKRVEEFNRKLEDTSNLNDIDKIQSKLPLNERSIITQTPAVKKDLFLTSYALEPRNLNSSNAYKINGYGSNLGNVNRTSLGVSSNTQLGDSNSSWLGRLTSTAKEVAQKDIGYRNGQPYNKTTGINLNVLSKSNVPLATAQVTNLAYDIRGKQTGRELFRKAVASERPVYQKLSVLNVASDITQVPLRFGDVTGGASEVALEGYGKIFGQGKYVIPESSFKVPQRITAGGEQTFIVPKKESSIIKNLRPVARTVGQAIPFSLNPVWYSLGMTTEGGERASNKNLTPKQRIYGGVEAGLGVLGLGGISYRWLTKPKLTILEKGKVLEPQFIEQKKVITSPSGEIIPISKYKITQKTIPPKIRIENKLFTLYEGELGKAQTYVTSTPFWTKLNEPVNTISFRKGAKFTTLSNVEGDTLNVLSEKLFRVYPKKRSVNLKWIPTGRRLNRARVTSIFGEPNIIGNKRITPIKLLFQDVTKAPSLRKLTPRQSASLEFDEIMNNLIKRKVNYKEYIREYPRRKISSMSGQIIEEIPTSDTGINFIKGSGRKSSSNYFKNLYIQEPKQLLKVFPKAPTPKVPKSILDVQKGSKIDLLSPIERKSIYYGKGLYERTEEVSFTRTPQKSVSSVSSNVFGDLDKSLTRINVSQKNVSQLNQLNNLKQINNLKQPQSNKLKDILGFKSAQKLMQSEKFKTYTNTRNQFKSTNRGLPKATPKLIPKPSTAYSTKGGKVVKLGNRYIIYLRRYGEDRIIGEASTLEEAKRILRNSLTSNLGRSGFITSKGKTEKINLDLGFGFRPSKRQSGRIVQESWFSLGSQSERKEIQRARKQSNTSWNKTIGNYRNKRIGIKSARKLKWW